MHSIAMIAIEDSNTKLTDSSIPSHCRGQQLQVDDPLVIRINVDGEPHSMSIPRDADIAAGVAKFAQSKVSLELLA